MNQITLKDGTTLDVVRTNGQGKYFQGANRDSLEFQFAKDSTTFDALDALFGDIENTSKITITDDSGSYVYENYTLRVGMSLIQVVISPEIDTAPEVTEERYTVTMAQKTYSEKQLEDLRAAVAALTKD